jgi:hypothetical protein
MTTQSAVGSNSSAPASHNSHLTRSVAIQALLREQEMKRARDRRYRERKREREEVKL